MFGKWRKKAKKMADEHGDKAEEAIDKTAGFIDDRTGGQHTDKIDTGAEKAKDFVEGFGDDQ